MAVTKILARNARLDQAIQYVLNGDKTDHQILTAHAMQRLNYYDMRTASVEANKAVYGPESPMAEKLSLLMASSPITAGRITIDADSGSVAVKTNPLWEKLRDGREAGPPIPQMRSSPKRTSKHKNQPAR